MHSGGMARLKLAVCEDGSRVVMRELLPANVFRWHLRREFVRGTKVRADLPPHENIIGSLERGRHGMVPYEIIEYVEGPNLRRFMQQEREYLAAHCVEILRQAAAALAHVHAAGYIHLDVKPENFLIVRTAEGTTVKLTDFDLTISAKERRMRKQAGTIAYMAPEQIRKELVGPAADIFAFGIVAYQLVTGRMPFVGNSEKKVRWAQTSETYRVKSPGELSPGLSPKLEKLIMKCLEKRPRNRFPSMAYLSQELAHFRGAS